MRLFDHEIAAALDGPAIAKADRPAPSSAREAARFALDDLDAKFAKLVEQHRQPGQSHEKALDALMRENPGLYAAHQQRRAAIIQQHLGTGTE